MTSLLKSLLVTGLITTAAIGTYAQTSSDKATPRTPTEQSAGESGPHMGMMGRMDPEKRDAMMAKHIAALKTKLKITAAQESAWTTFTAAMKPSVQMKHERPDRAELDKLPTPERIDKMRALRKQHMDDMQAAMDKRDDATKTFYAALTPEQQKVFDAEHARMGEWRNGDHGPRHGADSEKPSKK